MERELGRVGGRVQATVLLSGVDVVLVAERCASQGTAEDHPRPEGG